MCQGEPDDTHSSTSEPAAHDSSHINQGLTVSHAIVKTQAIAVYRKLGVKSRTEAVRKARQQGLLS